MGLRYSPFAFTEHGILMLSSVLNSEKAAQVNIAIMRVFLRLREMLMAHKDLALHLQRIDRTVDEHGKKIGKIYQVVTRFFAAEKRPKRLIGFHP